MEPQQRDLTEAHRGSERPLPGSWSPTPQVASTVPDARAVPRAGADCTWAVVVSASPRGWIVALEAVLRLEPPTV